jgi:putative ABC transport system permease protein
LSENIANELFDTPASAVGESVLLWGHRYRVVGVTKDMGLLGFNMGGADKERVVFLPASTAVYQEGFEPRGYVVMLSDGTVSHDFQIRIANAILLHRHRGVDDFEFFDLQELLATFEKVFLLLRFVFAVIGGVGLLVAGVGIMNVLLASVRQRIGELGIRRALGATQDDIKRQLLVESTLIAVGGGVVGSALGTGVTALAGVVFSLNQPGWVTDLSPLTSACALLAAAGAGLLFGTLPARKAARLSIIGCLRGQVQ